jgi:hypothetical protein
MARGQRVAVLLVPAQYERLRKVAASNGVSMSAILAELWDVAGPVLSKVADMVEETRRAKAAAKADIRAVTAQAAVDMVPKAESVLGDFDLLQDAIRKVLDEAQTSEVKVRKRPTVGSKELDTRT